MRSSFDESSQQTMIQMEMLREMKSALHPTVYVGGGYSAPSQGSDLKAFIRLVVIGAAIWFCWRLYSTSNEPDPALQDPPAAAAPANAPGEKTTR